MVNRHRGQYYLQAPLTNKHSFNRFNIIEVDLYNASILDNVIYVIYSRTVISIIIMHYPILKFVPSDISTMYMIKETSLTLIMA